MHVRLVQSTQVKVKPEKAAQGHRSRGACSIEVYLLQRHRMSAQLAKEVDDIMELCRSALANVQGHETLHEVEEAAPAITSRAKANNFWWSAAEKP